MTSVEEYVQMLHHRDLTFQSRVLRDKVFNNAKRIFPTVYKSSTGPQQIHPQYIADYWFTEEKVDTGRGNTQYRTYFKNLYKIGTYRRFLR